MVKKKKEQLDLFDDRELDDDTVVIKDNEVELLDKNLKTIDLNHQVLKSNDFVDANYSLTLHENRLLLILASKIHPNDDKLKKYEFRVAEIMQHIGLKARGGAYQQIKDAVKNLQRKTVEVRKENDNKEYVYNWLITSIYHDHEGIISLQFHPTLKEYFLDLKQKYTKGKLGSYLQFSSFYAFRIYEQILKHIGIKQYTFTLSIERMRKMFGIEENKLVKYSHFKKTVILKAQEDITKKTPYTFEFNEIKQGKKIVQIEFKVIRQKGSFLSSPEEKPKEEKLNDEKPNLNGHNGAQETNSLAKRLTKLEVDEKKIKYLIDKFPEDQLLRNVEYCEQKLLEGSITSSIGGYTYDACRKDYAKSVKKGNLSNVRKSKPIRTEMVPKFIREQEANENLTLKEKQDIYLEKYKDPKTFEANCLQFKEELIKIESKRKKLTPDELNAIGDKHLRSAIIKDLKERKELELELVSVEEFSNNEFKEIYSSIIEVISAL
ncbi:replication initiation protein [Virgibacillus sp. 6R]|uniref:replication initiation protein n=1 Tax=Metabacillus niabensis TaxID=324854 RepID=UPI001643060D